MAKFNITVELDWVDEEGGIDQLVKEEIVTSIVGRFSKDLNQEIRNEASKKISESVNNSIDEKVNEITEGLLTRKFDLLDHYGDVTKEQTSVIEILKSRLDGFLDDKVDENGHAGKYGSCQSRLDYIIKEKIDYTMKRKVEEAAKQVKIGLEKYMQETLQKQIGENVAKLIGVDKIVAKL